MINKAKVFECANEILKIFVKKLLILYAHVLRDWRQWTHTVFNYEWFIGILRTKFFQVRNRYWVTVFGGVLKSYKVIYYYLFLLFSHDPLIFSSQLKTRNQENSFYVKIIKVQLRSWKKYFCYVKIMRHLGGDLKKCRSVSQENNLR